MDSNDVPEESRIAEEGFFPEKEDPGGKISEL